MRSVDPGRFPNVVEALREAGLDPTRELVPVAPAAHYVMGGIATDLEGRTAVGGLYAVGECACTGLHGANRLASNSLSECFVFGYRAARAGLAGPPSSTRLGARAGRRRARRARHPRGGLARRRPRARRRPGLRRLLDDPHPLARLVAASALAREESRGAHLRRDHSGIDSALDGYHSLIAAGSGDVAHEEWTDTVSVLMRTQHSARS